MQAPTVQDTHDVTETSADILITGGRRLEGKLRVGGAKNAALPMMAAALLTDEPCTIENLPDLSDIHTMVELLRRLGATVDYQPQAHRVTIHANSINRFEAPEDVVASMRASFLVTGPLLARFGQVTSPAPGGCKLGSRPVDVDIRGLKAMGAEIEYGLDTYVMRTNRLNAAEIYMDYPSHTGTENLMMAATLGRGETRIINASAEPEIRALGEMLIEMGAKIRGLGTPYIEIRGVERLHGAHTSVFPDRLVAGTFAIGAVITGGEVIVDGVNEPDMLPLTHKLYEAGAEVWWQGDQMLVRGKGNLRPVDIQALPFPGFPTDLQAAFAVLLTQAHGESRIYERVFNDRLRYTEQLAKLGAKVVSKNAQEAVVFGPSALKGTDVNALDIRSGACLVLAGLVADGETRISDTMHLSRGYEDIVGKFIGLGADIRQV